MKWLNSLLVLVCAVCVGCADGGPAGTGISPISAITGNIVGVDAVSGAVARNTVAATLPQIQVSLDGHPQLAAPADNDGNFTLRGNFSGTVTLRFTVPQFQVTQQLDVPAGSTVVLQDVDLGPTGVVIQAARQLQFFGSVDLIDCSDGTLLIHERRPHGMQFLVRLDEQTSFLDASGNTKDCTALRVGIDVSVEGSIAYSTDRTITALVVTIAPPPPPPPPPQLEARFSGAVAALDCVGGSVVVDDSVQRTTIQLTPQTRIMGAGGPLRCQDVQLGDMVHGEGQINVQMPGVIVATQLFIGGPPTPGQPLRVMGFIVAIDCKDGVLQVGDDGTTIDVQLLDTTMISGRGGQPLQCTDLQVGDRVSGRGQLTPGAGGDVEAMQIMVTHPARADLAER